MEVQSPQSVQINFNNKIITLHNVTIVKNPKIITIDAKHYSHLLKGSPNGKLNGANSTGTLKLQIPSLVPMKTLSPITSQQSFSHKLNQPTPVIKEVPKISPNKIITSIQQSKFEAKPASVVTSSPSQTSPIKLQAFPLKSSSVIISPPKANVASSQNLSNLNKIKFQLKPNFVITNSIRPQTSAPTKVIISPPLKNKVPPCSITPPEAKKVCQKLEFRCIFSGCNKVFDVSDLLVEHMKQDHAESVRLPPKYDMAEKPATPQPIPPQAPPSVPKEEPKVESKISQNLKDVSEASTDEEDESEVNDLIMDLEDTTTQDTAEPDSPEFEKHVPESPEFEQHIGNLKIKEEPRDSTEDESDDVDYDNYEYFSSIMEPICELSCENDSNDGVHDENEAMRLYREAMEVNYQQNGIKKRGRRKQRIAKPLVENTTTLNGILASLLENASIKVPPGRGRGRRKEMNEEELEIERSNGVCLFSCNKCDLTFKFAGDLAKHVRSHTISSPYQCTICQRKFTHIGSLNTHLRIHSGERPYKCNQCDKSFTQSNSLMVHVKSHLSNKPFQCELCNKGFLNASSLALHQKTHIGPMLTVFCPIEECKKEFRDNNLLEEHMMTHRQSMLYQCSLCSEKFEQSCVLVQHVKTHIGDKPFQCNLCSKSFTQPGSLNTHLRIHTGEKPFKCEICTKTFTQASSLSVHMKVHGEKEFKCSHCPKSFGQEVYLKKHLMKHLESSLNDENMIKQ